MNRLCILFLIPVGFGGGFAATDIQPQTAEHSSVILEVKGPIVLGFFPPFTKAERDADDGGIREGLAHVKFALDDIAKCYDEKSATYRLELTRSITLRDRSRVREIDIPHDWEHSVGLLLVAPGREPRIVYATTGPSSLTTLGPAAVAEYFGASACRDFK